MCKHVHYYAESNSQMPLKFTKVQAFEAKAMGTRMESWTIVEVQDVFWFLHAQVITPIKIHRELLQKTSDEQEISACMAQCTAKQQRGLD
jgi:hypothetical protein